MSKLTSYKKVGLFLLLGVVVSHGYAMISRNDAWPVSSYPMYSKPDSVKSGVEQFALFAKTKTGESIRISLNDSSKARTFNFKEGLATGNTTFLEKEMLRHLNTFQEKNQIKEKISSLSLVKLQGKLLEESGVTLSQRELYSMDLN